jgi:hypothetical protein
MNLVSLLLIAGAAVADGKRDLDLDDAVTAHEKSVRLIHAADVFIEVSRRSNGEVIERLRWSLDGARERVRSEMVTLGPGASRFTDSYIDGTTEHFLRGQDPNKPLDGEAVQASKKPVTGDQMNMRAADFLVRRPCLTSDDEKRTLAELVHYSRSIYGPEGAVLLGHSRVDGHDTLHLRIKHPGVFHADGGRVKFAGSQIDVYLDPTANFQIRRSEAHAKDERPGAGWTHIQTVKKFDDFGNGVFLAVEVISEVFSESNVEDARSAKRILVTKRVVNEPLPEEALDFRWPANSLVVKLPPKNGRSDVELIGADNKVVRTIKTDSEMRELLLTRMNERVAQPAGSGWWMPLLVAIPLVVLGIYLLLGFYRRTIRRRRPI